MEVLVWILVGGAAGVATLVLALLFPGVMVGETDPDESEPPEPPTSG